MPSNPYSLPDLIRGYRWLDHAATGGFTEVSVLHPDYKPNDLEWNRRHASWPITRYITTHEELTVLAEQFAGKRMLCYGLNPRPDKLTHPQGRVRSAKERDITHSQSLLLDLDLHGEPSPERFDALSRIIDRAEERWITAGIHPPVRAMTGRGYHVLFAYDPISVSEHPDLRGQLRAFKDSFIRAFRHDLDRIEAKADSVQDLRRMLKAYGTMKPSVGIISTFPATTRYRDPVLREYLLTLSPAPTPTPQRDKPKILPDLLPQWFEPLLKTDPVLQALWANKGKPPHTDTSNSGYDFAIASYLTKYTEDLAELALVLAFRPTGHTERERKGTDYLIRTAANALERTRRVRWQWKW